MDMYKGTSDSDLARGDERFSCLAWELDVAPGTDDIKAKYQKALNEFKKKLAEIPVRIDELSKQKVDVDVSELELQKKDLEEKIKSLEELIQSKSNKTTVIQLEMQKKDIEISIMNIKNSARAEIEKEKGTFTAALQMAKEEKNKLLSNIDRANLFIKDSSDKLAYSEKERTVNLLNEYQALDSKKFNESVWKFDESTTVCSMCGQKLPADKIQEIKAEFNERYTNAKAKFEKEIAYQKKMLIDKGNEMKALETTYREKIEKLTTEKEESINSVNEIDKKISEYEQKLSTFIEVDFSDSQEINELNNQIKSIDEKIASMNNSDFDDSSYKAEIELYKSELLVVNEKISSVANNVRIDERIAELEKEQLEIAQKSAEQEKMLYLLEEFIKYKLNLISSSINSHFNSVNFRLFNVQMNGGLAETCECLIDGVPYSDANSGHKLVAGLDIIQALQNFYEITTVAFLDNAESLNDFNIPQMNNQLVSLSVSDDKELKVEV